MGWLVAVVLSSARPSAAARMGWLVAVVLSSARPSAAEPRIQVGGRAQTLLTARDELILGGNAGVGSTWQDRWQLSMLGGIAVGDAGEHVYADALIEGGIWLHPSSKLDVELGWRAGYSYIHLLYGARVHALMLENVFALEVRTAKRHAIRVEPLAFTAYHSGPWQVAIGARVGFTWRL